MTRVTEHTAVLLEPAGVYLLIMAYIWQLRFSHHDAWLPIVGWMVLSHRLHGEQALVLGFDLRGLRSCLADFAPSLAFLALALVAGGLLFRSIRPVHWNWILAAWAAYLPWGLFQQYVLNGYFLNRLQAVFPGRAAPVVAAALFSGAHVPNWLLMGVAFLAGYCCTLIYQKHKNLYFLGIAHATIGVVLLVVVPDSISHHMTVGPGWFRT
jgi:membrane protease YdiL (CAAX protease family)